MVDLSNSDLSTIEAEQLQEISIRRPRACEEADGAAENSVSPHGGVDHSRARPRGNEIGGHFSNKGAISKLLQLLHLTSRRLPTLLVFHLVLQQQQWAGTEHFNI